MAIGRITSLCLIHTIYDSKLNKRYQFYEIRLQLYLKVFSNVLIASSYNWPTLHRCFYTRNLLAINPHTSICTAHRSDDRIYLVWLPNNRRWSTQYGRFCLLSM